MKLNFSVMNDNFAEINKTKKLKLQNILIQEK